MCVAIPSRIVELFDGGLPMARISVPGQGEQLVDCCLAYVPEAQVGDYVLVANGFAIEVMDEATAAQSLAAFAEIGVLPPADIE